MSRIQLPHSYEDIISVENLLGAWQEFLRGKRNKPDVQEFERTLMRNIFALHAELADRSYVHGGYTHFKISDPKSRDIHKAGVRDRLLHHAIYRKLCPFFDRIFIADSYSCRKEKGTHRAVNRFRSFAFQVPKNSTRTCFVLTCDIRKFFASIDHAVLSDILASYICDEHIRGLLDGIIASFSSTKPGKGLPLGNLTSQLLVNVYMNEFDQFVKHRLKAKYYIRYADDFVFLSEDRTWLESLIPRVAEFLKTRLMLELHPNKVSIGTLSAGVDFLGWINFPDHRVLRTVAKRRMLRRVKESAGRPQILASYQGLLSHGNAKKLAGQIIELSTGLK